MKIIIKTLFAIIIASIFVYLLIYFNFLNLHKIEKAFLYHHLYILWTILSGITVTLSAAVRYVFILKAMNIHISYFKGISASIISASLGSLAPGSLAVSEAIRLSIMFNNKENINKYKHKLIMASFYDRLMGFWMFLLFAVIICFFIIIQHNITINILKFNILLLLLFIFFSVFPLLVQNKKFDLLLKKFSNYINKKPINKINLFINKIIIHLCFFHQISINFNKYLKHSIKAFITNIILVIFAALNMYFASIAIEANISFMQILAVMPILAIAQLIPLGFAGLGGYQFVAIFVLGIFNLNPQNVATTQTLQTSVNLFAGIILTIIFLLISYKKNTKL